MTNDSKLGMLAGVLGVVVAAVFFAKQPPTPVTAEPQAKQKPAPQPATPAPTASAPANATPATPTPEAGPAALPSTAVVRTRKDVEAQPTSRQPMMDEEP